jgi:hypothetical protein
MCRVREVARARENVDLKSERWTLTKSVASNRRRVYIAQLLMRPFEDPLFRLESPAPVVLSKEDNAMYRPRMIGYPEPLGKETFEFAIYGDEAPSSIARLTDLFLEHGVRLLKHRLDWDDVEKRFAAFYLADMVGADCSSSKLGEILRSKSGVESVHVISRAGSLFGYSTFPIILNGVNRGVILRIENWFQMEDDLIKWMGTAGESIMFREGEAYGVSTCQRYVDEFTSDNHALLFQNIRDGGKATGWGILDYRLNDDRSVVFLEVKYPVTNSRGEVTSRFFLGMLCGVMEVLLNAKLSVQESIYDRNSSALKIKYRIDGQRPLP